MFVLAFFVLFVAGDSGRLVCGNGKARFTPGFRNSWRPRYHSPQTFVEFRFVVNGATPRQMERVGRQSLRL